MNNAEKFREVFGMFATEVWAMPEDAFLKWLKSDNLHPKVDPNFSSCSHCVHDEDSEEICILRKCVHAIAELKECYTDRIF